MSSFTKKTTRNGNSITTGIVRHLRPNAEFLDMKGLVRTNGPKLTTFVAKDNLGGVTFAFEIDHDAEELTVGFAVCSENFDKMVGRQLALAMLEDPDSCLKLKHVKGAPLVDQTIDALMEGTNIISWLDDNRLQSLIREVKRILKVEMENPDGADRYSKALDHFVQRRRAEKLRSDNGC